MKFIDKLGWLLIRDNKLLCVRSKGKSLFYIPGGKRDPGESDQQALSREIEEELSVFLRAETFEFVEVFRAPADGKAKDIEVKVTCYVAEYKGELKPESEIEEMAWLDTSDLERCSAVAQKVVTFLAQSGEIQ